MIGARQLLSILVGGALGAGGWLIHLPTGTEAGGGGEGLTIESLREEVAELRRENASLRSLAQGGGEVAVPGELIARVEADFGLSFLSNPVVHLVAKEELGYRVEASLESFYGPQGLEDREGAYQLIGWLREGDDLKDQYVAVRTVGARAWYDEVSGEGWVTDAFDLKNVPDQAAMLGLLTRILLGQHFPGEAAYAGDDTERAREALHGGAAANMEARFYAANAREIGFLPMNDNGPAARLLLVLPEFVQGVMQFPVMEGKTLVDGKYVQGVEEFQELFRDPPQSTYEVMFPGEERVEVDLFEGVGLRDEVFLRESAGYLGLRLWVAETGDVGLAEEVARDLVGDEYVFFADGEASKGLLWRLEFADRGVAERFLEVGLQRIAVMAGAERLPGEGDVVETENGRFLRIARRGETVVEYMNVATAETAKELGGNKK